MLDEGHKTIFIDHGYCQSLYVQDPDDLTLEFTSDPKNIDEINEWQSKTAHETLARWVVRSIRHLWGRPLVHRGSPASSCAAQ